MLLLGQSSFCTSQNWLDSEHLLKLACWELLVYYMHVFFPISVCATRQRPSTGFFAKSTRPWGCIIVFPCLFQRMYNQMAVSSGEIQSNCVGNTKFTVIIIQFTTDMIISRTLKTSGCQCFPMASPVLFRHCNTPKDNNPIHDAAENGREARINDSRSIGFHGP